MEEIKKTLKVLKSGYGLFWTLAILIALTRELLLDEQNGQLADDVRATYYMETLSILLACVCVPVALKLFAWVLAKKTGQVELPEALRLYKRWSLVRLSLLFLPVLAGLATYYSCLSTTGILCAAIALTASLFCVPSESRLRSDLHLETE